MFKMPAMADHAKLTTVVDDRLQAEAVEAGGADR